MHRQGNNFDPGRFAQYLARGLDAIQVGHGNVHDHHLGGKFLDQPDHFPPIVRFTHNLYVRFSRQQRAEPVTHYLVVVRQYDLDHITVPT